MLDDITLRSVFSHGPRAAVCVVEQVCRIRFNAMVCVCCCDVSVMLFVEPERNNRCDS